MRISAPSRRALRLAAATLSTALAFVPAVRAQSSGNEVGVRFALSFPRSQSATALDGRMLVMLSTDGGREPRFLISTGDATQQIFGIDVDGLSPGVEATIQGDVLGYPVERLADIPPGDYYVQGLFHRYDTFHRSDGHVVKLPMDRGEGQQWNLAPGNLISTPRKIHIDPRKNDIVRISLDKQIPPITEPKDTKYIKHIKFKSELLTKFWGRPMYLGAILLLPEEFDTHPRAHYPLAVYQGHFQHTFEGFQETPPDQSLPPVDSARLAVECPNGHNPDVCKALGYDRVQQQYAYDFYKKWTGPGFPRVIILTIQHANPYYDDSYAVNSENLGPYGDAITYELIPYLERTYRGLGPWARGLYGGSTGGWESLGVQIKYPDQYNGTYANCPDPIDFRQFTVVNIYKDTNAYYSNGPWRHTPRPGERNYLGHVLGTIGSDNQLELVLGTNSRSGQQWDIWEAVFSPVGPDGYPKRIWDKRTGVIDHDVANYWHEHYDLQAILRRNWATLGPKLKGKININVGDMDTWYLNNAVYLTEDFLKGATNPTADAKVDYGNRDEHCWSGDHSAANAFTRLTYNERFVRQMTTHWLKTAPAGADTTSWRY